MSTSDLCGALRRQTEHVAQESGIHVLNSGLVPLPVLLSAYEVRRLRWRRRVL